MSSRKNIRYKLLLDEGLPPKDRFPTLNNLHSVKHIKHDLKKGGAKDYVVYNIAAKGTYIVVVFNTKDFEPLIDNNKPAVISLSTNLSNEQIDLKLCKLLKNLKPREKSGHLISINNEGSDVRKINNEK